VAVSGQPTDQLKVSVDAVLAAVSDTSIGREGQVDKIMTAVDQRFDFEAMSRRVLGKEWKNANAEQQQEFVKLFRALLSQTYLVAIEEYNDEEVEYGNETVKKDKFAQVDTNIVKGNRKTPVNYRMYLRDGDWYVYDVVIEGVSLVNNYRSSYPSIVARDGMDALLSQMNAKVDCNKGIC
jgi:phospholipid transport system substrate-binding protein